MHEATVITGTQLRRRYRAELRAIRRHPSTRAAILFAASLLTLFVLPALAEGPHTFHLQGADIGTEFVSQPYAMAAGTLDGRHFNLEAGLLGFTDGRGLTGTGYCADARTHRRHDAAYTDGPTIDAATVHNARAVLWLLRHGYPNGPALLGGGPAGLARSSSVVQAALWHFSDEFQLDPAGSPFVDSAYRAAYESLLREAALAGPPGHALLTLEGPPGNTVSADPARPRFDVAVRVFTDDGSPAPDGTEVLVSSNAAGLATLDTAALPHPAGNPLTLRTSAGRAAVSVAFDPASAGHVSLAAQAVVATPPGRLLVSSVPTQRLVETTWGRETVEATTDVTVLAPPRPTPSSTVPPPPVKPPQVLASAPPTPAPPRIIPPSPATPRAPTPAVPPIAVLPPTPVLTATPVLAPTPLPLPTPPLPSAGHDVRLSVVLSTLLSLAGIVVLWRSRGAGQGA
ncbi:MAG: thioester domain-containing protein [Candidatus Dormibacteria bacterium]